MQVVNFDSELFRTMIKESVIEAIRLERFHLIESFIPEISDNEMQEIISKLGKTPDYREYTDATELFS